MFFVPFKLSVLNHCPLIFSVVVIAELRLQLPLGHRPIPRILLLQVDLGAVHEPGGKVSNNVRD